MSRPMPYAKAVKIMKDYNTNGFNAKKTLLENGYKESTADKQAKVVIETAQRKVAERNELDITDPKETSKTVLDILGYSSEDIVKELKKVIEQDRDFTNKLKALAPALRDVGIKLENEEKDTKVAVLNIGVEATETQKTPQQSRHIESIDGSVAE